MKKDRLEGRKEVRRIKGKRPKQGLTGRLEGGRKEGGKEERKKRRKSLKGSREVKVKKKRGG